MYFEIALIPFAAIILIFLAFWITQEGSRWQKHRFLGVFARFIQASPGRAFVTFLMLTVMIVPCVMFIMWGTWADIIYGGGQPANTVTIVNTLLIMFLLLAGMIPVLWGSFRTWRHSVRSAADMRVRSVS